jgi:hypothetical protein
MRKIIFAHQGKCGGSTLVAALRNSYGPENVYNDTDQNERWAKHKITRFLDERLENRRMYRERASYKVIHGHFVPQKYRRAFPEALYITLFRNPIQQLVSLYYYWLRSPVIGNLHPYRRILMERKLSLTDFAELIAQPGRIRKIVLGFRLEYFHFVGITEAYDSSLKLLKKKYLPDLTFEIDPCNTNPSRKIDERYELDYETFEHIGRLVAPRLILYADAVERFRNECLREKIDCKI